MDIFQIMERRFEITRLLRRVRTGLALFAMILQSLGAASHAGAMAAAMTGNQLPLTGELGLLQICTPTGIVEIDPHQLVPDNKRTAEQPCPLCSASALGSFTFARVHPLYIPLGRRVSLVATPRQISGMRFLSGRKGLSRAPPA